MRYEICLLIQLHSCVGQITISLLIDQLFTEQKNFQRCLTSYNLTLDSKVSYNFPILCHTPTRWEARDALYSTFYNLSSGLISYNWSYSVTKNCHLMLSKMWVILNYFLFLYKSFWRSRKRRYWKFSFNVLFRCFIG